MATQECKSFPQPETLKDILELLDKLGTAHGISSPVLGTLEEVAKKYFKDSGSEDSDILSPLGTVFTNASGIRKSILDSSERQYGKYGTLDRDHGSHASHSGCAEKISNALKEFLPQGYAALLFMLFNCDGEFSKYSLGHWHDQKVNDSGVSTKDLFNWLTKEKTTLPLTPGLIKRGFSTGELTSNTGETVADNIKNIITHDNAKDFQKVLLYLLLVCPWDHALLGHALCFISKFCSEVGNPDEGQKNFEGYSEELKDVCRELSGSLNSFVQGSSQSHISAVSQGNSNVYNDVFKDESLDDYCDWLRKNLKHIIESLTLMSTDCKTWNPISFEWGFTAGPFLYGFVPKDKNWMTHIDKNLPPVIKSLIESLEKLEKALQTSSAGATAGGVVTGLFGLGGAGAGAAYGLNLFGFKNLVTGLISGFFK